MTRDPGSPLTPDGRFDEKEVDRILARAIELESDREGRITEELLLEIAVEAGISPDAVAEALEELRRGPRSPSRFLRLMQRPLSTGAGMFVLGAVTSALRPFFRIGLVHVEAIVALVLFFGVLLAILLRPDRDHPQRGFQLTNLAAWMGLAAGFLLVYGSLWDDVYGMASVGAALSAGIGGVITHFMSNRKKPRTLRSAPELDKAGPTRLESLRSWFRRILRKDPGSLPPLKLSTLRLGAS